MRPWPTWSLLVRWSCHMSLKRNRNTMEAWKGCYFSSRTWWWREWIWSESWIIFQFLWSTWSNDGVRWRRDLRNKCEIYLELTFVRTFEYIWTFFKGYHDIGGRLSNRSLSEGLCYSTCCPIFYGRSKGGRSAWWWKNGQSNDDISEFGKHGGFRWSWWLKSLFWEINFVYSFSRTFYFSLKSWPKKLTQHKSHENVFHFHSYRMRSCPLNIIGLNSANTAIIFDCTLFYVSIIWI